MDGGPDHRQRLVPVRRGLKPNFISADISSMFWRPTAAELEREFLVVTEQGPPAEETALAAMVKAKGVG